MTNASFLANCLNSANQKFLSEKGHGLGHVTLIKFGIPSNISPKTTKATDFKFGAQLHLGNFFQEKSKGAWPRSRDPNKICHTLEHTSKVSKATDLKFSTLMHVVNFWKQKNLERGMTWVT